MQCFCTLSVAQWRVQSLAEEMLILLPADVKVIGNGIKQRLEGVEQEPLLPEMEDLLRDLGKEVVADLGEALGAKDD